MVGKSGSFFAKYGFVLFVTGFDEKKKLYWSSGFNFWIEQLKVVLYLKSETFKQSRVIDILTVQNNRFIPIMLCVLCT